MKNFILIAFVCVFKLGYCQKSNNTSTSFEFHIGLTNPIQPLAPGYDAKTLSPFTVGLAGRHMFNHFFGLKLSTSFHQFNNAKDYSEFKTNYFNTHLESVIHLGNVLHFYDWTNKFNVFMHFGGGYSIMKEVHWTEKSDQMMNFCLGFTPAFKLSENASILLDFKAVSHIYQSRTFDFSQANMKRGADGYVFNISVGFNFTIGNSGGSDWNSPKNLTKEVSDLSTKIDSLKMQQDDSDGDGVANYLDQEPNSAPNAEVTTKGITIDKSLEDKDSDGVPDLQDNCPFEKGTSLSNGCPDEDNDGVENKKDDCPYLAGSKDENGCPEISESLKSEIVNSQESLVFQNNSAQLSNTAKSQLMKLAEELKKNPHVKLVIYSHVKESKTPNEEVELSQNRANSIRIFLVEQGVASERIRALGMGTTRLISEEQKEKNDRIELKIKF